MVDGVEVADGVHRFGSALVNWYVVTAGDGVCVVDTGFPRHWKQLEPGLARLGRRLRDIGAVIITHSHVDHTGFADRLSHELGRHVAVHRSDAVDGARRFPPMHLYARPSSWQLLAEGMRDGMLTAPRIRDVNPVDDGTVLDAPGAPRLVHLGGHTPGSAAIVFEDRGVVFTGDNLVTMDPYTRRKGPQLMLCGVQHDPAAARAALGKLAQVPATIMLPGHGDPWTDGITTACAIALEHSNRAH